MECNCVMRDSILPVIVQSNQYSTSTPSAALKADAKKVVGEVTQNSLIREVQGNPQNTELPQKIFQL